MGRKNKDASDLPRALQNLLSQHSPTLAAADLPGLTRNALLSMFAAFQMHKSREQAARSQRFASTAERHEERARKITERSIVGFPTRDEQPTSKSAEDGNEPKRYGLCFPHPSDSVLFGGN